MFMRFRAVCLTLQCSQKYLLSPSKISVLAKFARHCPRSVHVALSGREMSSNESILSEFWPQTLHVTRLRSSPANSLLVRWSVATL